ncbi:MAG: hypothetical protein EOO40_08385, partial [Deltaproteobacteria bacterium]
MCVAADASKGDLMATSLAWQQPEQHAALALGSGTIVVGIGASAGGRAPLEALLRELKLADMTVIILQHLASAPPSNILSSLAEATGQPTLMIEDGMPLVRGRACIAPPQSIVRVEADKFTVSSGAERSFAERVDG